MIVIKKVCWKLISRFSWNDSMGNIVYHSDVSILPFIGDSKSYLSGFPKT